MLLFADYETYYTGDYSLKKMTPAEYIINPLFQAHGMAIKMGKLGDLGWIEGCNLPQYFDVLRRYRANGGTVTMVTFNALFDMAITAWVYGFVPDLMIDVLGMARACLRLPRYSLKAVLEHLQLAEGQKGDMVSRVIGFRTDDIKRYGMWEDFKDYAKQDVNGMVGIFNHLLPMFPQREFAVMDLVLRCAVQPQFEFDKQLLIDHLKDTKERKADLLARCGLEYDENGKCPDLMSTAKFAALLENLGVVIEMKTTATGREAPALAKTDEFMQNLLEHDDETVAALAAARLGHKSTLEETRCQRFINISMLPAAPGYFAGAAPMPLRYGAAHTMRLGGEWKINVQNLPRKSKLRNSIKARKDHKAVTADEAQIEARLSAWLCGEQTLLREFTDNLDPYGQLGASIFGLPAPVKGDKDWRKVRYPVEGFIGKTGILGLGYAAGADKFFTMVNSMARVSIPADKLATFSFPMDLAQKSVGMYRKRYWRMPYGWNLLQNDGMAALTGSGPKLQFGPATIQKGEIVGPNGEKLLYPDLRYDPLIYEWTYYAGGNHRAKIYGAKLLENITQWLARIIVMDAALRLNKCGLRFALQAHDELVFHVHENNMDIAQKLIMREMIRRPTWGPDIPLEAEIGKGDNYGAAK